MGGALGQSIAGKFGSLTLNTDGSYSYLETAKANTLPSIGVGQELFTYQVTDGHGGAASATLSITITAPGVQYTSGTPEHGSGTGKQALDGSLGYQKIVAGNGADVLIGGNDDVLSGGNGPDTFIFAGEFGRNEITDFNVRTDTIQLSKQHFADFASILAHSSYDAAKDSTTIVDGTHGTIVLDHVQLTQQDASHFWLV